jgi:hypothetical protein
VLFLVVKRWSRRFGRAAPFVAAALLVADVGVWSCPGRLLRALDGEADGPVGLNPLTFVWSTGAGGFFILVAVPVGFAMTAAIMDPDQAQKVRLNFRGSEIFTGKEMRSLYKILGRDATLVNKRAS